MVSSFYSNNEKKQRKFVKENKMRELNQEEQQQVVDSQTSFELAKDIKAENLRKLATRVVNKLSTELIPPALPKSFNQNFTALQYTPLQLLTNIIKAGQLTNLFDEVKTLPDSILNKKQKLIRNDLNDNGFKSIMNENIAEAAPSGDEAIAQTVVETMGGYQNQEEVFDMMQKANKEFKRISQAGYSFALERERKKKGRKLLTEEEKAAKASQNKERKMMGKDDKDVKGALYPKKETPSQKFVKEIDEEEKKAATKISKAFKNYKRK